MGEPFDPGFNSRSHAVVPVPVVVNILTLHEFHDVSNVLLLGTELACGNDEDREIRDTCRLESFVDFGDPPKTDASRRSH